MQCLNLLGFNASWRNVTLYSSIAALLEGSMRSIFIEV